MLCGEQVQMIVGSGCIPITAPDALTTRPSLYACYLRILLILEQTATAWATGGVYVTYTWPLPEMGVFGFDISIKSADSTD